MQTYNNNNNDDLPTGGPGTGIMGVIQTIFMVGMVVLFAWQTWGLVDWLFPTDSLVMKILTLVTFDVGSLAWTATDLFFYHKSWVAQTLARVGAVIDFILSLLATISYFIVVNIMRYHVGFNLQLMYVFEALVIVATVVNVVFLVVWWHTEYATRVRHPLSYAQANKKYSPVYSAPVLSAKASKKYSPRTNKSIPSPVVEEIEEILPVVEEVVAPKKKLPR